MKVLSRVKPTAEQLPLIKSNIPGAVLIRGAAGSGKTTTVLLRLRFLGHWWVSRKERLGLIDPVRALVLTFNRTLRGYVNELVMLSVDGIDGLDIEVSTFAKWSRDLLGCPEIVDGEKRLSKILELGSSIALPQDFLVDEVEYVLSRFLPENLNAYLTCSRDGRGIAPRVDRVMRQKILDKVIGPLSEWKRIQGKKDWNDLAVDLSSKRIKQGYDIVVIDEAQDFSANQVRAIVKQLNDDHSITLVTDAVQRIYPSGSSLVEAGLSIGTGNYFRLTKNYRNTIEIAKFALPLLNGMPIDDDGTLPDFNSCERSGPIPKVLKGKFGKQANYVINYIKDEIELDKESVAILHAKGGGWFADLAHKLDDAGLEYVSISRKSDWPSGDENIALSTLHSAKGLEFDHVIILGLSQELTPHGDEAGDDLLEKLRRLLAMAIGRARQSVIIGYKPEEASSLIGFLDPETYEEISV